MLVSTDIHGTVSGKYCPDCGTTKALTEFYSRKRNGLTLAPQSVCKSCQYARTQRSKAKPADEKKYTPAATMQRAAIKELCREGIPCDLGTNRYDGYVDILAWGCVRIEVKSSMGLKDGRYRWRFTSMQIHNFNAEIIIGILPYPDPLSFYVFSANDPIFFHNYRRKCTVSINIDAQRGSNVVFNYLTTGDLEMYRNNWNIIEDKRLEISERLKRAD